MSLSLASLLPWYVLHFARDEAVVGIREYDLGVAVLCAGLLVLVAGVGLKISPIRRWRIAARVAWLGSVLLAVYTCSRVLWDIRGINEDLDGFSLATIGSGTYLLAFGAVLTGLSGWHVQRQLSLRGPSEPT